MNELEQLLEMDLKSGVLFMAIAVVVVIFLIQKWDFIISRFGIKTKKMLNEEKQERTISKNTKEIEDMRDKFFGFVDRSEEKGQEIFDLLKELKQDLQHSNEKRDYISAMEVRFSLTQRCEDAIANKCITFRGLQSIDDLYDVYSSKDYLGMNSYVTSLVEKVHTLNIIGDPIE